MRHILKRAFASKTDQASARKQKTGSDKRYEMIQDIMYGNKTHRTLFKMNEEMKEQHEVIERMWCLEKQREADRLQTSLKNKYVAMRSALEALEKVDKRLFDEAIRKEEKVVTFPLKLRVPTETIAVENWSDNLKKTIRQ